jgi:hypothetical protein
MSKETTLKPRKRAGRGGYPPPDPKKPFTTENQPTPEAKKAGWLKKKRAQELVKAVLELGFQGKKNKSLRKEAAEYFTIDENEITFELMLLFKQTKKAIDDSDTPAFNALMDRGYGKPKEKLEHSGPDDGPIETTFIPSPQAIEYSKIPLPLRLELLKHIRANKPKE